MPKPISVNSNSIGQRIKELRFKKGLSQTDLARIVGCAQNTIAEWERNERRGPGKQLIGKVAQALDVSVDYLLNIKQVRSPHIKCYGTFSSLGFVWPEEVAEKKFIEITAEEYVPGRFAIQISDDFLEPHINIDDYAIFEKISPKDGDIVAVRFPENGNKGMVKKWRQRKKALMLLESNPHKVCLPHPFHLYQESANRLAYTINLTPKERIIVEGKLVGVKRKTKNLTYYNSIH